MDETNLILCSDYSNKKQSGDSKSYSYEEVIEEREYDLKLNKSIS